MYGLLGQQCYMSPPARVNTSVINGLFKSGRFGSCGWTRMSNWEIGKDETIHDCLVPVDDPWQIPVCKDCGQVAFRVIVLVGAEGGERKVPLCGRHFINACLRIPELRKYDRGGKLG
jgi:hypothetical protein